MYVAAHVYIYTHTDIPMHIYIHTHIYALSVTHTYTHIYRLLYYIPIYMNRSMNEHTHMHVS